MNELTQSTLDQITALATDEPVLTVYVTADPADRARVALDLRAQRTALLESLPHDAPRERIEALTADVARIALEQFDGRPARTQTIAGVLPIAEDAEAIWCELPEIEETTFRLGSDPYLLPILRQFELHRPSLVVLLALDQYAILEWHAGVLTERTRQRIDIDTDEWRDRSGPFNVRAARGSDMGSGGMSAIKDQDGFNQRLQRASVIEMSQRLTAVFNANHDYDRAFWFGDPALIGPVLETVIESEAPHVEHIEASASNLLESTIGHIAKQIRTASIANWREHSAQARDEIDALPPARRVAGVSELHDLAVEGRVSAAYIELLQEAPRADSNGSSSTELDAALTAILRSGGDVHIVDSLPPSVSATDASSDSLFTPHEPVAAVASTLRW